MVSIIGCYPSPPYARVPDSKNDACPSFQHGVELATASGDLAGLVSRLGGIEPIVRGAAYARAQGMDVSFAAQVSVASPLFNLPVEAVQRGRDHGEGPARASDWCRGREWGQLLGRDGKEGSGKLRESRYRKGGGAIT